MLSSADFTYPQWFQHTRDVLLEAGDRLFELGGTQFIFGHAGELHCQTRGGRHRVNMLVFALSIPTAERINTALAASGNLGSDCRPTLRLSPRDPAGDIYAVETRLSSDSVMNWRVPALDGVSLLSFSDAHSLPKLGCELTVLPGGTSYSGLTESLMGQNIICPIEFFPEEGEHHYSRHCKCSVRYSPAEVDSNGPTMPRVRRHSHPRRDAAGGGIGSQGGGDLGGRRGIDQGGQRPSSIQEDARPTTDRLREPQCRARHEKGPGRILGPSVQAWRRALGTDRDVALRDHQRRRGAGRQRRRQSPVRRHRQRAWLRRGVRHHADLAEFRRLGAVTRL